METYSEKTVRAYESWKARKIANLPSIDVWIERQRAKVSDEKMARRLARMEATQARQLAEAKARMEAMRAAVLAAETEEDA